MSEEARRYERPRRSRDAADIVACRLGDARAASIIMTFSCSYAYRDGDFELIDAAVKTARKSKAAMDGMAKRLKDLAPEEQPDSRGYAMVVDVARNPQFMRVMTDHGLRDVAEPIKVATGDVLDLRAADLVVGREALLNELSVELARRHVRYGEIEGNVSAEEITEALEGAARKPVLPSDRTFALTETEPIDDIVLTLALGVLWAAWRSPRSKDAEAVAWERPDFSWVV